MSHVPHAPYASQSAIQKDDSFRTDFQRDRDRILYANAFRKLQGKTQVFRSGENDYYRTRLTHTLEVAQIARGVARVLAVNEDLTEAIALAHDLGHPPFGHAGEDVLHRLSAAVGGFDHNVQAVRIVLELEHMYGDFDGLGLSWSCLEGLVKHNGPIIGAVADKKMGTLLARYEDMHRLCLVRQTGIEGQIAAWADDVAYLAHDFQDGVRADILDPDQIEDAPLLSPIAREVRDLFPGVHPQRRAFEVARRLINDFVRDVIQVTQDNLAQGRPTCPEDVRQAQKPFVTGSAEYQDGKKNLRAYMNKNFYQHHQMVVKRAHVPATITGLFEYYSQDTRRLPPDWQKLCDSAEPVAEPARIITDYIAGMTDRYAIQIHEGIGK